MTNPRRGVEHAAHVLEAELITIGIDELNEPEQELLQAVAVYLDGLYDNRAEWIASMLRH